MDITSKIALHLTSSPPQAQVVPVVSTNTEASASTPLFVLAHFDESIKLENFDIFQVMAAITGFAINKERLWVVVIHIDNPQGAGYHFEQISNHQTSY